MITEKRLLAILLLLFLLLGSVYALTTPTFEASDELWHYPMIRHLADGNPLPVQVFNPALAGPWKQEASQPPLYYYVGAALTFWIDASDMETVRWLNPHVNNGIITADGNTNLAIHDPFLNPWQGTLLAVRIVRLASVLMGAATVYLTYRLAKEVAPKRPEIAIGAAALVAFNPMFLFISGAVNNDNLVIPLATLALFLMVRLVNGAGEVPENSADDLSAVPWQKLILLGIVIGLGALTKITAVGLLPLAFGTLFIRRWQLSNRSVSIRDLALLLWQTVGRFLVILLPVLIIAGWWYIRNIQLYGDWSGWNAFIAVLGQRAHPASLAQLWGERWGFMLAYWGLFGGVNIPMSTWIYHLLNLVVILSVPGFLIYLVRERKRVIAGNGRFNYQLLITIIFDTAAQNFALIIAILWSIAVVVGLIQWATTTWSSQGRLVFSAIGTLNILMVVGLVGWLRPRIAAIVVTTLAGFLLVVSAAAPFLWIRPAYQPPELPVPADLNIVDRDFGGKMRLIGYTLSAETVQPGETVDLYLVWEVLGRMDRNWSVFVHLDDPVLQSPVAQRDMYLGQGLLATTLLQPGQRIVNHYRLALEPTTYAPSTLSLVTGLYDYNSAEQERLLTGDGFDAVELDTLLVEPLPGEVPNPVNINFENQVALVGYDVMPRRVLPGEMVEVTLYFRALKALDTDYTVFAQIVGEDTTRWGSDDQFQETSQWLQGEITAVKLTLTLNETTPAAVYPLIVGLYVQTADGSLNRLQIMTAEGRLTDDFLVLTRVRVD
ncbi:MAG: glycosyltransferase family 39 protein [Candidatus Promineifilaceae bacterium]